MTGRPFSPGPRDNGDSPPKVLSLREAEPRVRLVQLFPIRGPEFLRRQVDLDLLDRAREPERGLVEVAHRRAGVFPRVERLVRREPERDRPVDPSLRRLLAVHEDRSPAAL